MDLLAELELDESGPLETDGVADANSVFCWTLLRQAVCQQAQLVLRHCVTSADAVALCATGPLAAVDAMLTERITALGTALQGMKVPASLTAPLARATHPAQQMFRLRGLQDISANPFKGPHPRRLWHWLITRQALQGVFEKAVFPPMASVVVSVIDPLTWTDVFRTHSDLVSLCVNPMRPDNIAVASSRNIYELLVPSEFDDANEPVTPTQPSAAGSAAGWGGAIINAGLSRLRRARGPVDTAHLQRTVSGTRHLASHPSLGVYLTGNTDGSIQWLHYDEPQPIDVRTGGPRITCVAFDSTGKRFGATDVAGDVYVWPCKKERAIFQTRCHNKRADCFAFLSSASFLATGGLSTDHRNVALWDMLLPPHQSLVASLVCCDGGVRSIAYCPDTQRVFCGGHGGDIVTVDARMMAVQQRWAAHDGMVKALVLAGDRLVSLGAEGAVKLWTPQGAPVHAWPNVHTRSGMLPTGTVGTGLVVAGRRLFSCGSDGLVRQCFLE